MVFPALEIQLHRYCDLKSEIAHKLDSLNFFLQLHKVFVPIKKFHYDTKVGLTCLINILVRNDIQMTTQDKSLSIRPSCNFELRSFICLCRGENPV